MRQKHIQYTYGASFMQTEIEKYSYLDKALGAGKSMRKLYRSTATESMGPRNNAICQIWIFLSACLFMRRMQPAPITELVQLDLAGNRLLVLPGVVIHVLTR